MKQNHSQLSIELLQGLEYQIKLMLQDDTEWKSLDVDYYPPRVERLYANIGEYRIHLHIIHQTNETCLYHKHRWPAVFKQLKGSYTMGITYCAEEINSDAAHNLPTLAKFLLNEGSYYEMTQTDCLHYVQPFSSTSYSIMLTQNGVMYPEANFRKEKSDKPLHELSEERIKEIKQIFFELL